MEKEKPRIKLIYRNSKQPTFVEKIKNGRIVADKYNTAELKFQTPNIVIVFSNEKPDCEKLSKDKWKIFKIIYFSFSVTTYKFLKLQYYIQVVQYP